MNNNMLKVIALTLSFSLLGQNLIFAQAAPKSKLPLAAVQQQAKQDHQQLEQNNPQLIKGLLLYSTLATFAVVATAIISVKRHAQAKATEKELEKLVSSLTQDNNFLQKASTINAKESLDLAKEIRYRDNKIKGLTESRNLQIARRKALEAEKAEMEEMFSLRLQSLSQALQEADRFISMSSYVNPTAEKQLAKYSNLFDESLPKAERTALRAQMETESWFKAFSKEEQKDFLKIIDETLINTESALSREGTLYIFASRSSLFYEQHAGKAANYLRRFGRTLFSKGNLIMAAILLPTLTISMTANAAPNSNPEMASRIEKNFDLFLNASEQELQKMQQYEDVYEACVQGAAVLHTLTLLDEAETEEVQNLLQPARVPARPLRTAGGAY